MRPDPTPMGNSLESVVVLVADEVRARQQRGERPDVEEYAARYPEYATELREVLEALQVLDRAAFPGPTVAERPPGRRATPRTGTPGGPGGAANPDRSPGKATLPAVAESASDLPSVPGYEVLGKLGRGGQSVVFKARYLPLDRIVALKMIPAGSYVGPEELDQVRREAGTVARLKHPNIVEIYEIGEHDGLPYLALEYVEGGSLHDRLGGCPLPAPEAAALAETLARAMEVAHARDIIHRDLKPANVLLTADGTPKITDFGLAKRLDTGAPDFPSGTVVGTVGYMSPEQASGRTRDIGPLTDVYALGALLYEMLTGRPPFLGDSLVRALEQVCSQEPVPVRRLQPRVPRDLETICLQCLRKEPHRRYASALDLAEDLRRFRDGRPILARPVPAWERGYKWARRRPAQAALVIAVAAAVLSGAAGVVCYGLYQHQWALYESQRADDLKRQLERQATSEREWKQGLDAEQTGDLEGARTHMERALANWGATAAADPGDYRRVEADRDRVVRRLKARDDRRDFEDRTRHFEDRRADVLFHQIDFLRRAREENRAAIRRAAPDALKQFNVAADDSPASALRALEAFRPHADTPEQLGRIAAECYQVLLVWAEAEAPPDVAPGDEAEIRRALHLLDLAGALADAYRLPASQTFHLRRARCLALLGDDGGAGDAWAEAEQAQADTALDVFLDALALYRRGQSAEAATACVRVLRLEPGHFWARYLQALCYLHAGQYVPARDGLTACLGAQPDFFWARLLRATAEGQLQDFEAAEHDFAQVFEGLGQADDTLARFVARVNRGAMRARRGAWAGAVADLREAIALQPDAAEGYVNLAEVYRLRQDWEAAVSWLDEGLSRRRGDGRLYHTRALALLARGDATAARRDFEQAIAHAPAGGTPDWLATDYVELAYLQNQGRQYDAALACCDAALQRWPDHAPAHLARARALLGQHRYRQAGEALDRYLLRGPSSAEAYRTRGAIHLELGEPRKAVDAFSTALKLQSDADTWSLRGWAYLKLDAAQAALPDFEEALRLRRGHVNALCGRGYARVRLGSWKDGLADAEAALAAAPPTSLVLVRTACTYARALRQLEAQASGPSTLD